jgi:hypothetical protein
MFKTARDFVAWRGWHHVSVAPAASSLDCGRPERTQPRYRHQSTGHFVGLGGTNELLFQFVDIRSQWFPLPDDGAVDHAVRANDCVSFSASAEAGADDVRRFPRRSC